MSRRYLERLSKDALVELVLKLQRPAKTIVSHRVV